MGRTVEDEAPRTVYLHTDGTCSTERESLHDVEYLRGDWVWDTVKDWPAPPRRASPDSAVSTTPAPTRED